MPVQAEYRLTQYSHGAGCGCKIAPATLERILHAFPHGSGHSSDLLVGNELRDDAAVIQVQGDLAIISTTDFFMPIVDDAEDFGRIASVNAISDIYAMAGTPILAIAILGWPVKKLPAELAGKVLLGARKVCAEAGIPLAGGHSIDSPEPIFGLAVTGKVSRQHLKKNDGARPGDLLYLTKPLGVGILTTAWKKDLLLSQHAQLALDSMLRLNTIGQIFGIYPEIHAMTDVTGFGLAGHLLEMCEASGVSAVVDMKAIPILDPDAVQNYLRQNCIPGGTLRNYESYGNLISDLSDEQRNILCDPQTSGGLLVAVDPSFKERFEQITKEQGLDLHVMGHITESRSPCISAI